MESSEAGLTVGASVTLTALLHALRDEIKSRPAYQGSGYRAIAEQLRWYVAFLSCSLPLPRSVITLQRTRSIQSPLL